MASVNSRVALAMFALGAFALSVTTSMDARAQAPAVDPAATKILKRMTDYLGGLKTFRVHTQNTIEDLLAPGERVDIDVSASVTIKRPNMLHTDRTGDLVSQDFFYNGKTLTLYDPTKKVYAAEPAPPTLAGAIDFARNTLGLVVPAADLVFPNAYELLMEDVTSAQVIGKSMINGVKCDHLLFRRPGVDFQVWISDGKQPLPRKYVVTDTSTAELLSVTMVMSDWKTAPKVSDATFNFVPPKGTQSIPFMHLVP
jgi:hypothetical protein